MDNSFGVEFGIAHNLTSRSVFPYYIDNKLVGYLELGEEIDYFTDYFSKTFGAEILVVIKNKFIDIKNLRLTSKLEKLVSTYPKTKNYYIINSTLVNIDDNLKNLIDIKTVNQSDNYIDIENITYELESLDIQDIEQRVVGKLIVLIDTKTDQISLKNFKFNVSVFISGISFFIMMIYYLHLRYTTRQLNRSTSEIIKLSITDQLTNLYNRRYFNEMVPIELQKAIDNKKEMSFIMLDIDNFKKYNDNYGHLKGDRVLENVSKALQGTLKRSTDMVFRMGGEEFCIIIIENTKENSSQKVAKEILNAINDLNIEHLHNQPYNIITMSMGISIKKANEIVTLDTLYKDADIALYESKNSGKNMYSLYSA